VDSQGRHALRPADPAVINLETAKALGLEVPANMVAGADQLIQ
jgi:hypothetical protein